MKYGVVQQVYLNDDAPLGPYSVKVLLKMGSSSEIITAIPLNINHKKLPAIGEYVSIQRGPSSFLSALNATAVTYYYSDVVPMQGNINSNILKGGANLSSKSNGSDYASAAAGLPKPSSRPTGTSSKNKEFEEVSNLSQLQPYSGDIIHEGRFGQSIRFGYTPQKADAKIQPSWDSSSPESPITIIRNGAGDSNGYNKFVIEDINKDDSSIWLGSKQKIGLKSSNKFTLGATPTGTYNKPQIILNSDRIVLNSKTDSVLISGAKAVNVSTPNWKADMDVIFTQLELITDALLKLAPQLTVAANGGGPVPSLNASGPQLLSTITQVKTQLQLMKQ